MKFSSMLLLSRELILWSYETKQIPIRRNELYDYTIRLYKNSELFQRKV